MISIFLVDNDDNDNDDDDDDGDDYLEGLQGGALVWVACHRESPTETQMDSAGL